MSQSLVLLVTIAGLSATADAPAGPPIGTVMATIGRVEVRRGGVAEPAGQSMPIRDGDRLEVPADGASKVYLYEGHSLYLGPGAIATIGGSAGNRQLGLEHGQVRAVVEGGGGLALLTPSARVVVDRGIFRAEAGAVGSRFWGEAGEIRLVGTSGATEPMAAGQEIFVPSGPGAESRTLGVGRAENWEVPVEALQMAGAAVASRRLKGDTVAFVNEAVAMAYQEPERPQSPDLPTPERPSSERPGADEPAFDAPQADEDARAERLTPERPSQDLPLPERPDRTPEDRLPRPLPTPPTNPEATDLARAAPAPAAPDTTQPEAYQPIALAQPNTGTGSSAVNLALGNISGSSFAGASGALFSDAQQQSLNPLFPGNVHLVTAETRYVLGDVALRPSDNFPTTREYFSIGQGPLPNGQVLTTFRTGSDPVPQTIRIPRTDNYLIRFPQSQYGVPDPANGGIASTAQGIAGLLGPVPVAPQVSGATPLRDPRAQFNDRATFALGEFALQRSGRNPQIDVRRSDQDRRIIKSGDFNDLNDQVTPNRDVAFVSAPDPAFFPNVPTVEKPVAFGDRPTYRRLDNLRRAAATTLLADRLSSYARRTGQTRFVLDGQVVDISGYQGGVGPRGGGLRGGGLRGSLDRMGGLRADRLQQLSLMRGGLDRTRIGPGAVGPAGRRR